MNLLLCCFWTENTHSFGFLVLHLSVALAYCSTLTHNLLFPKRLQCKLNATAQSQPGLGMCSCGSARSITSDWLSNRMHLFRRIKKFIYKLHCFFEQKELDSLLSWSTRNLTPDTWWSQYSVNSKECERCFCSVQNLYIYRANLLCFVELTPSCWWRRALIWRAWMPATKCSSTHWSHGGREEKNKLLTSGVRQFALFLISSGDVFMFSLCFTLRTLFSLSDWRGQLVDVIRGSSKIRLWLWCCHLPRQLIRPFTRL